MFGPIASAPIASLGEPIIFQEYYVVPMSVTFGGSVADEVFLAPSLLAAVTTAIGSDFDIGALVLLNESVYVQESTAEPVYAAEASSFVVYVTQGD